MKAPFIVWSWQNRPAVLSVAPLFAALSAETVGDPESTRRVYTTVVIFLVLGVAMIVLAVWLFRRTRPDPQLLAPLEVMDSRRWRRSAPAQRGRELDEKRPPGARPLNRSAEQPEVDTEFAEPPPVRSFDDLAGDLVADLDADVDPVAVDDPADPTPARFVVASGDRNANGDADDVTSDGEGVDDGSNDGARTDGDETVADDGDAESDQDAPVDHDSGDDDVPDDGPDGVLDEVPSDGETTLDESELDPRHTEDSTA